MLRISRGFAVAGVGALAGLIYLRYGWFGRAPLPEPAERCTLSAPGEPDIAMTLLPRGQRRLVVVAHGFMKCAHWRPQVALVRALSARWDVLSLDFPGHGQSGGCADFSYARAAAVLRRVLEYAATLGYDAVGVIGYSMGAAAAIVAAGQGAPVDAVVSVSCPGAPPPWIARGFLRPIAPWRWWVRYLGTRLDRVLWFEGAPMDAAARVSPRPLLLVHCGLDTLVREVDSRALFEAAMPPKEYLHLPGVPHAWPPATSEPVLTWLDAHLVGQAACHR